LEEQAVAGTLKLDNLWGRKEITVPVSVIERFGERAVYLYLNEQGAEAFSSVPVRRLWR
jgi:hypothetical protein